MQQEYINRTLQHKKDVADYMTLVMHELADRAVHHDDSKFSLQEAGAYQELTQKLQGIPYGSEEYKQAIQSDPGVIHHYVANDHHPEHFNVGIYQMNLIQLLEMACDWIAAAKRNNADIRQSLEINRARYNINDELYCVLVSTVKHILEMEKAI